MGLASPAHSNKSGKCHKSTTVGTYGNSDDDPVGGDGGHVPPRPR